MNNYVVYKHTSPTGKSYIGITNNYYARCARHKSPTSECTAISNAIKKYGWESFEHTLLKESLSLDEANYWEGYYIDKENTLYPNGYNLKTGGSVIRVSDETKAKLSALNIGKTHTESTKLKVSMAARNMSDKTKAKMSESAKKKIFTLEHKANISASTKGKIRSEDHRARLAERQRGKTHSPETKLKISESLKKRSPEIRRKAALSRMNTIIRSDGKEFKGMESAALDIGCSISSISHTLHGRQKAIKGFSFTYKMEQKC